MNDLGQSHSIRDRGFKPLYFEVLWDSSDTLPAKFLWPLTNDNATLLCQRHNAEKAEKWPSEFYTDDELKRLVALTGIPYDTLAGKAHYNPAAITRLRNPEFVDALLTKYAAYMDEMIRIRNRILDATGFNIFGATRRLSRTWIHIADEQRKG